MSNTGNNYIKSGLYWKIFSILAFNSCYNGKYITPTSPGSNLFVKYLKVEQANFQTGKRGEAEKDRSPGIYP